MATAITLALAVLIVGYVYFIGSKRRKRRDINFAAFSKEQQALALIVTAYCWSEAGYTPIQAIAYGIETVRVIEHGTAAERKMAQETYEIAMRWSVEIGVTKSLAIARQVIQRGCAA